MSYILEALRKSQQERDLGRVPTLESVPAPTAEAATVTNYWGAAAVGLAALAVVIALYAALRGAPQQAEAVRSEAVPGNPAAVTPASRPAPVEAEPAGSGVPADRGRRPAPPPQPAGATRAASQEPAPVKPSEPPRPAAASEPARAGPAGDDGIPDDLRHDIEAFKREIRGEPAVGERADAAEVRPQDLRLPREVRKRLPAFLMTVHVYDSDRGKRFVHINSRRYREGERTREDVLVEEIFPDGVVLSYEGHRFFRRR